MRKGLIIVFLAEFLILSSLSIFSVFAAKKEREKPETNNNKGVVTAAYAKKHPECKEDGYEGGLRDYRDSRGKFCFAVRQEKTGKRDDKKIAVISRSATPTPTPTPRPTATPTPHPTATPTLTPTPTITPTPTPPQVVVVYKPPKRLPATGFPTGAVAAGAIGVGSLGAAFYALLRRHL